MRRSIPVLMQRAGEVTVSDYQHHHDAHDRAAHAGHDTHAGHSAAMFRDKFWLSLLLTLPIAPWQAPGPRVTIAAAGRPVSLP